MLRLILLFSLLKYSILQNPTTHHWDYQRNGPDTWRYRFDSCEGELQSPINIRRSHVKYDQNLDSLFLDSYTGNKSLSMWNFTHNGHTIIAYPPPLHSFSIRGANLPGIFRLKQFHFHWGFNAYQGSEHTIDGIKYPLEIHFVHEESSSQKALAVISILFELKTDDNPHINELLSILNRTTNISLFVEQQLDISQFFPTTLPIRFYRYNGSLTTPPCTENVHWIILVRHIRISAYQLEVFIKNSEPFNFRSTQKLYSRLVSANFNPKSYEDEEEEDDDDDDGNVHHSSTCSIQIPVILLSFTFLISIFK